MVQGRADVWAVIRQRPLILLPWTARSRVNMTVAGSSRRNETIAPRRPNRTMLYPDHAGLNADGEIRSAYNSGGASLMTRTAPLAACALPSALVAVTAQESM